MVAEALCEECGLPLTSIDHIRGIGLHGHIKTTKAEADKQRADVMRRAQEFSDRMMADPEKEALKAENAAIKGERAALLERLAAYEGKAEDKTKAEKA